MASKRLSIAMKFDNRWVVFFLVCRRRFVVFTAVAVAADADADTDAPYSCYTYGSIKNRKLNRRKNSVVKQF